jgi:tellurite resistance protein TehA-like permease
MATGIVSLGLDLDGRNGLSGALLALTLALWVALTAVAAYRLLYDRAALLAETRLPGSLCGVAATSVLAAGLAVHHHRPAAATLVAAALLLLVATAPRVLAHRGLGPSGSRFLLAVAPFSLAATTAVLVPWVGGKWLVWSALALALAGVAAYLRALMGFDFGQLLVGKGDHWVAGGALAVGALAWSELARFAQKTDALAAAQAPMRWVSLALAAVTSAWLAALVAAELRRPRLGFDRRRWATAFPVAMYAAMCLAIGPVEGADWISELGRIWVWVGLGIWAFVGFGALRRARALAAADRNAGLNGPEQAPNC